MLKSINIIAVILTLLLSWGCSEPSDPEISVETSNPVIAADEVAVNDYSEYEALFEKSQPHAEKYLALRDTDPEGALEELKKGLGILYENHPKAEVYAELLFERDSAGEATHPQLLVLSELILEMSVDNGYPKEVIEHLRASIKETQAEIAALKADGRDPDTVVFDFTFDPTR